jgi:hypothetical protein
MRIRLANIGTTNKEFQHEQPMHPVQRSRHQPYHQCHRQGEGLLLIALQLAAEFWQSAAFAPRRCQLSSASGSCSAKADFGPLAKDRPSSSLPAALAKRGQYPASRPSRRWSRAPDEDTVTVLFYAIG